jgi:hypothetical protein
MENIMKRPVKYIQTHNCKNILIVKGKLLFILLWDNSVF